MTTVVNGPGGGESSGMGIVVGVIIALAVVGLAVAAFFVYGLPAIQSSQAPKNGSLDINVTLPANTNPAPGGGDAATD